jgi:hypothetical protein
LLYGAIIIKICMLAACGIAVQKNRVVHIS